eukprot:scaffold129558_cov20-Tisochrysis_lutea.AAC.1
MQGARISSNSWGTTDPAYDNDCREIDAFARQYDMLILFAAGESSTKQCDGLYDKRMFQLNR